MRKPNEKYEKFEAYRNGWDAYCLWLRDKNENIEDYTNPYNPTTQKFSHDLWNEGYMDNTTGNFIVWSTY